MLPLLTNTDIRIHHRCKRKTIVYAAIQGPMHSELRFDRDALLSYALGAAIAIAFLVVCLDITIWRP